VFFQCKKKYPFLSKVVQSKEIIYTKHIYEKEMLAILHALKKWRPYLMGRHFKVKMVSMIMITNMWEAFGSIKYLGMIVQKFLEI